MAMVTEMLNKKKHLGYKKMRGQSEVTLQTGAGSTKSLISAEAKKKKY